jgi:hypothetical protein
MWFQQQQQQQQIEVLSSYGLVLVAPFNAADRALALLGSLVYVSDLLFVGDKQDCAIGLIGNFANFKSEWRHPNAVSHSAVLCVLCTGSCWRTLRSLGVSRCWSWAVALGWWAWWQHWQAHSR